VVGRDERRVWVCLVLTETPSDTIDIVRDAVAPGEYKAEEDPRLYRSAKTGRGPLADDWARTAAQTGPLMCAYKLCKVEFRYWGMQAKIEQFIHDVGEHPDEEHPAQRALVWPVFAARNASVHTVEGRRGIVEPG
jgi:hypothetical protein